MDFFKKYFLILSAVFVFGQTSLIAAEHQSRIVKVVGETSLIRDGEDRGESLGALIKSGDTLQTQLASVMDVSLNGRVGLRLLPLTKVVALRLETPEPEIQLLEGNVIGLVRKGPLFFEVETPDADLRTREGRFWARYQKGKTTGASFSSLDGEARISPKTSSVVTLVSKQAVDINQGAAPETRWASAAEIQAVSQAEDIEIL